MDFVSVRDVVRANLLALKSDLNEGFYNVGTGNKTDLNSLCKLILEITVQSLNRNTHSLKIFQWSRTARQL